MDRNESATIDRQELKEVYTKLVKDMKESNCISFGQSTENKTLEMINNLTEEQIELILNKLDVDNNGTIEYSEFLAHSLTHKQLTRGNIKNFFHHMLPQNNIETMDESPCNMQGEGKIDAQQL